MVRKTANVGTSLSAGQTIATITQGDFVYVTANFKETQLTDVRVGQPVEVEADAFPGITFEGRVQSINEATGASTSLLPPDNATGNFTKVVQCVPVRIVFITSDEKGKAKREDIVRLRQGISVTATIDMTEKWDRADLVPARLDGDTPNNGAAAEASGNGADVSGDGAQQQNGDGVSGEGGGAMDSPNAPAASNANGANGGANGVPQPNGIAPPQTTTPNQGSGASAPGVVGQELSSGGASGSSLNNGSGPDRGFADRPAGQNAAPGPATSGAGLGGATPGQSGQPGQATGQPGGGLGVGNTSAGSGGIAGGASAGGVGAGGNGGTGGGGQ